MNKYLKDILKNIDAARAGDKKAIKAVNNADFLFSVTNRANSNEELPVSAYDFYKYFCFKAKENGIIYKKPYEYREKAVLNSLLKNFTIEDIKWLIDTAWDVKHNIMPKENMNIFILSKAFLRSLYPLMLRYRNGEIDKYGVEYDPRLHISKNKNLDNGGVWIAGIKVT